jgi:hypothetical protein
MMGEYRYSRIKVAESLNVYFKGYVLIQIKNTTLNSAPKHLRTREYHRLQMVLFNKA